MNKGILLLIMLTALISVPGFGQEKDGNDYDSGEKHITGTDYSYYKKKRGGGMDEEILPQANAVKAGLTSWITGVIPFYYERRVTPWLGLQFGLGLTTRDFTADVVNDLIFSFSNNPERYNNYGFYGQEGRKSSVGAYVSFQPKFYPKSRALRGFYVSPLVEYKRFDFVAQYPDPTPTSNDQDPPGYLTTTMPEYRNTVDFTVNVGRQWLFPTKVSLELMGGVGFRKVWEQRRVVTQNDANIYNPNGYSQYDYIYTAAPQWFTYFRPELNFSLIIGGYW